MNIANLRQSIILDIGKTLYPKTFIQESNNTLYSMFPYEYSIDFPTGNLKFEDMKQFKKIYQLY